MATNSQDGMAHGFDPMLQQMSRKRRPSNVPQDMAGPIIRRTSRLEPRPSIQYGGSRRMSYASRSSISGHSWAMGQMKPQMKMANTYRLGPTEKEKFNSAQASNMMKGVLESYLEGEKYDSTLSISLSKNLAEVIKERIKNQGFSHRYKYVCVVTLGEKKDQGMTVCSRCVWNTDTDNYASVHLTIGNLLAVATLYAIYFE